MLSLSLWRTLSTGLIVIVKRKDVAVLDIYRIKARVGFVNLQLMKSRVGRSGWRIEAVSSKGVKEVTS